jgi:hypothetical protein
MTSSSASDHGSPAGIAVLTQRGTTSKEMEANKNFDKWLSLGRRISGTFGYTWYSAFRIRYYILTCQSKFISNR